MPLLVVALVFLAACWFFVHFVRVKLGQADASNALGLVLLVIIVLAVFYVGYWDTAAQKCNRGDLGACIVYEAQQTR